MFVLDRTSGEILRQFSDRWGYGVGFGPGDEVALAQPSWEADGKSFWGAPLAVDLEGREVMAYDAPCPPQFEVDCEKDPDNFWQFTFLLTTTPDGQTLLSNDSFSVATWDFATGEHLATSQPATYLEAAGFDADGNLVSIGEFGSRDETYLIWSDPRTLDEVRRVKTSSFYFVSPDGDTMISLEEDEQGLASEGTTMKLTVRDGATGEIRGGLDVDAPGRIWFNPYADTFARIAYDRSLTIWDSRELTRIATVPIEHEYDPTSFRWLDEDSFSLAYQSGAVAAYTTNSDLLLDLARSKLTRGLTALECETYDVDPCPTLEELKDAS